MITRLNSLPNTALIKRDIDQRNQLIANTSLIQIDSEEESRALSEHQKYFHTPDFSGLDASSQELVGRLVAQRSQLLEENIRDLGNLLRLLLDNNDAASALIATTEEFHQLLLGNLMWVRNFSFVEPAGLFRQVGALLSPADWLALPAHAIEGMQARSLAGGLLLLLLISLLMHWQLRGSYKTLMSTPTPLSSESLWNILLGMGLSVVLALHWPLALWLLGYFLEETPSKTAFTDALSAALLFTARILYLLLLTRLLTHRMGVGHRFLKWNAHMLDSVRNELNWAGPVTVLAILVSVFAYHHNIIASGGGLSAIANTTLASTVIVACIRLLRQDIFTNDVLLKTALRMFAALGAMVIIMQLMGLLFAAEIYLMALGRSVTVLLVVKTVGDILERWLLILRASLKRKARDELKAQLEEGEDVTEEGNNQLDVVFLSEAHAKLLGLARLVTIALALWLIWSPSLPALNLLDSTTLWHVTDSANPGAGLRAITLFDFSLGVLVLVVTGLLTRHLPSVSEVFMREWFNMSSGSRYASTILMQYMVIAVGGSLFLTIVGWEWSKVQWLVAAMGVGIGFGLQEIVANFISGIIILFERPVRVGDIISAGGAEGVVRKINPRATIIETFDRKEHLIPNKELITGQVINWSLSENEVRVVIPVGIAYGSDVRLAMDLLLQAAREVEQVLAEPEPTATFEDFGDNSLLLWLRCYVAENRPKAWTELRTCINDKLTEAGIAMAFPQRDVHLDMASPLRVEVSNPTRGKD
jgi:potassium efflux system protein